MKNIWISGSVNSGKTTVSKVLSKELGMVVLELDSLSEFVENFLSFEEYIKLNYEIFPEIVEVYNKRGLGVIVVYPLGEKVYLENKDYLDTFRIISLDPGVDIASSDRGSRVLTDWERERVAYHYNNNIHNNSFAKRIDTKDKSVEAVVKEILEICK